MQPRVRQVLAIALPIIGGMVSQNVLNLVDTAMVGGLGDAALAAVGTGSFANFLAMAFITGLSAGVLASLPPCPEAARVRCSSPTSTSRARGGALMN